MSQGNIFAKLDNEYYQLTGSEKKVADYVATHPNQTQFMSISELAEECGVAEATISRFCRRMKYKGYSAFKLAVANSLASRDAYSPLSGEVLPGDTVLDMCKKIYSADVGAMAQTLALIRPEAITQAADLLLGAEKVLCMGQGGSMILAQEAAHLFSTAMPGFFAVWDSHMQAIAASQMTRRDVVLYFSYSGSTRDVVDVLKVVRKRGGKSILITRFPKSPGAAYVNVVLPCGSKEDPYQLGSVAARVAQLFLVDVLFSEICRRDIEGCRTRREQVADVLSNLHI